MPSKEGKKVSTATGSTGTSSSRPPVSPKKKSKSKSKSKKVRQEEGRKTSTGAIRKTEKPVLRKKKSKSKLGTKKNKKDRQEQEGCQTGTTTTTTTTRSTTTDTTTDHQPRPTTKNDTLRQSFKVMNEKSISDLSAALGVKKQLSSRGVKWADDVDTKQISMLRRSAIDTMFYTSTDIAEFRYAAFMEDCGLDPADFE